MPKSRRTLPLRIVSRETGIIPGLGECLSERLGGDLDAAAPVIAEVLVSAGLAEPAEVLDAATRTKTRGSGCCPHGPGISHQETFCPAPARVPVAGKRTPGSHSARYAGPASSAG